MRIITGSQRGRKLLTLEGLNTRPTSEKVKEALFSIIQFEIEGRRVLDLFAGSGQLGMEALSRGARECVFVDNDREAIRVIRQNAEKCGFTDRSRFFRNDYTTVLKRLDDKFDIILVDPPYASSYYDKSLKLISGFDILAQNGIIVVESESNIELPESVGTIEKVKDYKYGRTKLTVYRNKTDGD